MWFTSVLNPTAYTFWVPIWYDVHKVGSIQVINWIYRFPKNTALKFWWLLFQILPEKNFDLIFALIFFGWLWWQQFMVKFWNFTMKLFQLIGFTQELVFGWSTSVTGLNLFLCVFLIGFCFLRKNQEHPVTLLKHLVEVVFY